MDYGTLKTLHVLSSTLLFGTGLGSAFYLWRAARHGDAAQFAFVARQVVLADWLFTATAVVFQPLSGWLLARTAGHPLDAGWLQASYGLYLLAGACWLPVVWLQYRLRDLARDAARLQQPLPARWHRCLCLWFVLGWPAFGAVALIFWLMVNRPGFGA
ncbi:MAG: DUF2269 domain-containing protein [Ottowia sp.]|nr:MAG: DUF2269 domain-containing protein [Ottowia sp.]